MARSEIEPITEKTLLEFGVFLNENLNSRRRPEEWVRALNVDWGANRPNNGFLLRDDGRVVGGIGAYYSDQTIRGHRESFCNITSWSVLESHRSQSMRLALRLTEQPGYHFTNFSPTTVVMRALHFLKFKPLDERKCVIPNPLHVLGRGEVVHEENAITSELEGEALRVYRDHSCFPWLRQLLVGRAGEWCHVIYKRGTFKRFPSAAILHVSDANRFRGARNAFFKHVLGEGMLTTSVEFRLIQDKPFLSRLVSGYGPRLFRSPTLSESDITQLYSEQMAMNL